VAVVEKVDVLAVEPLFSPVLLPLRFIEEDRGTVTSVRLPNEEDLVRGAPEVSIDCRPPLLALESKSVSADFKELSLGEWASAIMEDPEKDPLFPLLPDLSFAVPNIPPPWEE